jgi:D-hydroxyproline dehydrogenase subunit alpha
LSSRRIVQAGITEVARTVSFSLAGENLTGLEGETIAAALIANGKPLPLFCGMGVCGACLVTVNGKPSQRACMTRLRAGMQVMLQHDPVLVSAPFSPNDQAAPTLEAPEVLVIGGGPAGLAATRAARLCGAEVTLIDERAELGGQYFKQPAETHRFATVTGADAQFRRGRKLIREVKDLGARIMCGFTVWGAFPPNEFAVSDQNGKQFILRPSRVVLATGAYERSVPLPGWTLPGVMTTGAAQSLVRSCRVQPGKRLIVAGNGPLNIQLAVELARAGLPPVAVFEAAPRPHLAAATHAFARGPHLTLTGIRYLARLRMYRVPVCYGTVVTEVCGTDRVQQVVTHRIDRAGRPISGTEQVFSADTICFNFGFSSSNAISLGLGCAHRLDADRQCLIPIVDENGRTDLLHVYATGDGAGLRGAYAALEEGFIAGVTAARDLGHAVPRSVLRELARRRRRLVHHGAFQDALWTMFKAPPICHNLASAETVICRCEGVKALEIRRALEAGANTLGQVKRRTRSGMGWCQGRGCIPVIAALIGSADPIAPRPPIMPVRVINLVTRPPLDD